VFAHDLFAALRNARCRLLDLLMRRLRQLLKYQRAADEARLVKPEITEAAMRALTRYSWPGNVRELLNVLTRAMIIRQGREIRPVDLHLSDRTPQQGVTLDPSLPADRQAYQSQEAARIRAALQQTNFNVSQVSRLLGIPRQTLYRKLKKYGIETGE
jgi:transcriptional regulator of acetoin/glycerol metabolism